MIVGNFYLYFARFIYSFGNIYAAINRIHVKLLVVKKSGSGIQFSCVIAVFDVQFFYGFGLNFPAVFSKRPRQFITPR